MIALLPRNPVIRVALICAFALQAGCRQNEPITSWGSPRMLEVTKEWQTLHDSFSAHSWSKDNFEKRMQMLRRILQKRLSHQDMVALAATCDTLPVDEQEWSGFHRCVVEEMLDVFVTSGDREELATLLSSCCPSSVYFDMSIEHYLVRFGEEKLKDPLLILGDAYSKCQSPQVRQVLAKAVRRGLKGFGIRANTDAEFFEKAMKWYEQNKDQLVFNPEYGARGYYKSPLFKWKSPEAADRFAHAAREISRKLALPAKSKPLKDVTNSIGMKMVLIPPGEFLMGAPDNEQGHQENETPQHPVRITKPFWLGACEVTEAEYEQMMGNYRSDSFRRLVDRHFVGKSPTSKFPADTISWHSAAEFCNRLSKEEGLPVYYRVSQSDAEHPWKSVDILGGPGYRLPTEAEWEYACRAGTTTPYSFGESINQSQANVNRENPWPHKVGAEAVGSYPPNAFGLYDMHGNVPEWCEDLCDAHYYEDCPIDDPNCQSSERPAGPSTPRNSVARGGGSFSRTEEARSAHRIDHGFSIVGIRVAKSDSEEWEKRMRDLAARDAAVTLTGHTDTVMSVAFSPDGKTLASGSEDRTIRLWDVATAKNIAALNEHRDRVTSVAFSPDGKTLASGSKDGTIKLWNVESRKNTAAFIGHTGGVASVAFSPDGKTIASGSWDLTISLWHLASGKKAATLKGHPSSIWTVAYSPDGKALASACQNLTIKLWDMASDDNTATLDGSVYSPRSPMITGYVSCVAFNPDGKTLALAGGTPVIQVWDVATRKIVANLEHKFTSANYIAYSPNGKTLASVSGTDIEQERRLSTKGGMTIRLWDLATGKSTVVLRGRPKGFLVVVFSPDGKTLAAGGLDGEIKLSPVNTQRDE